MSQGVMIIDSFGNVSKEVDIAVYDEQYTPYVFQYNALKFIPIEAVAVVIECKSKSPKETSLDDWVKSINQLLPNPSGIVRIVNGFSCAITNKSQLRTRPIKILATIKDCGDKAGENIKEKYGDEFDFIIIKDGDNTFNVLNKNEDKTLEWWAKELNGCEENLKILYTEEGGNRLPKESEKYLEMNSCLKEFIIDYLFADGEDKKCKFEINRTLKDLKIYDSDGKDKNPLLSLNLQLNQLLMLINNPMPFPHFAYAKIFREIIQEAKNKTDEEKNKKSKI
ncbi:DUF6602 domain-containing protein [Acetivibrio straminisolvens]|uniref:DUF6602 domain-containing protein n=1 Tax=Acetivibrio straminisolvens TaxID=253314 RepID=UPI0034E22FBA